MFKIARVTKFMAFFAYDIVLLLGFIAYLPVSFWRKKMTLKALWEKFGFIEHQGKKSQAIWLQVVSVGEVNLIEGLLRRLQEVYDAPVVVSTTTLTGNIVARRKYTERCSVIFFPLDVSWIVRSVIGKINPQIFIAIETEIWPNVFRILHQKGIPIIILNARISDAAFGKYMRVRRLLRPVLRQCTYIGAQNDMYKQRYLQLGADPRRIAITGNLKWKSIVVDHQRLAAVKKKYTPYLKPEGRLLWLAASTHQPEEEIIIDVYKEIIKTTTHCSLLLAPRHPERVAAVERMISLRGFRPVRLSEASAVSGNGNAIFIVDTVGDLLYLYGIADVCFVGGSLSGDGGHNILEPMYFLKPTLFGPSMNNFADIAESALKKEAALMVSDAYELRRVIQGLLDNEALRQVFATRCLTVFEAGKNVLADNVRVVLASMAQAKEGL